MKRRNRRQNGVYEEVISLLYQARHACRRGSAEVLRYQDILSNVFDIARDRPRPDDVLAEVLGAVVAMRNDALVEVFRSLLIKKFPEQVERLELLETFS